MTSKFWGNGKDTKCQLYKEQNETVHHIVSGCKMISGTKYSYRHNQVAKYVHWCVLKEQEMKIASTWLEHVPENKVLIGDLIIMWDVALTTDIKC